MNYQDILKIIPCEVVNQGKNFGSVEIKNVIVSDMMSEVLTVDKDNIFLITSLSSHQTLRTLDHVAGSGCIIVNNSPIQVGMKELAKELGLTILHTELPAFEVSVAIGKGLGL